MNLEFINMILTEAEGPRIPHPEDAIFSGLAEAQKYERALEEAIGNAGNISIKWDGGIALFFGYTPTGEFFINDKYMPEGFYARSPADWEHYDTQVKKSRTPRPDLYPKIAAIWQGLQANVTDRSVFKGDLMAVNPAGGSLPMDNGAYVFPEAPTVKYSIPPASPIGALLKGKVGAVVVHQKDGAPWDGKTGLANKGNVAVIAPKAGLSFKLKNPVKLVNAARTAVNGPAGAAAEQFLAGMEGVAKAAIQKYFNHKITLQTNKDLIPWIQTDSKLSAKQIKFLIDEGDGGYIVENAAGYEALRATWNAVYQLKENLAAQLEQQVKGFGQTTGGQPGGEGFVVPTSAGLIKLVNRVQFGGAHFNK